MKYIVDGFERIFKYIIDSSKLTIKKMKVVFFFFYLSVLSCKYFIKITQVDGKTEVSFEPGNNENPISILFGIAVLIIFLVLIDILDNHLKSNRLSKLILDDKIPLSLKEKIADELIKIK